MAFPFTNSGQSGSFLDRMRRTSDDGLGRGGPLGLRDIIGKYFLPEFKRQGERRGGIEDAFLDQALEPGALFGAANTAAQGYASELFKPGGEVAALLNQVRGKSVARGFDPSVAEGAERGILGAATSSVGNFFAQQAGQLEGQRFGALTGAYGESNQAIRDLLESIYSGVAGAEQLQLAKKPPRSKFLGIF